METGLNKTPDDEEGIIRVRLKDEAVIKYLSEGIYTSWKSSVRELFANELTAALTAREMVQTQKQESPTIEITVDPDRRELTIQGKNSLGITMDTFADKVIYYGRSGNVSSKRPGRFGFGAKCVSSDTECLTLEGWKKYSEISIGDLIATYNIKASSVEYKPIRAVHTYEFQGELFRLGWSHGPIVTGNHRNVVSRLHSARQGGTGKQGVGGRRQLRNGKLVTLSDLQPRKKTRVEEIIETSHLSNTDKLLLTAPHKNLPNLGVESEDLASLIGWVITEGYYFPTKGKGKQRWRQPTGIAISQNEGDYADEIRDLLRRLKTTWREQLRKNKNGKTNILFAIHGPLASKIRQIIPDKQLNSFLTNLPKNELEALFWSMIKGDGGLNHGNRGLKNYVFSQKSKLTLDWFQIIALRLGYYCGTGSDRADSVLRAYISKRKYRGLSRGHGRTKLVTPIRYSGIVWCPEVENGTWVARRDGWPFITGNSYVSLGKSIRIESFARETGERYGIIGSEGIHFTRIPDGELTISEHGTKVSILLRNDGREEEDKEETHDWTRSYLASPSSDRPKRKVIELDELIETIENVCRFSEIGTYLTITSDHKITKHSPYSHYVYETTINRQVRKKINFTPREYAASRIAQGNKSTSPSFEFELDDPDFYFYGLLASSGRDENEVDVNPGNGEVRLLCMPIEATIPAEDNNHATKEEKPEYPMTYWYVNARHESLAAVPN